MNRVVVVGSSNTDLITYGKRLPKPGETVLHERFLLVPGGKGANQAVAASRAGADVVFVGAVGDDTFGAAALESLRAEGIDCDLVRRVARTPSGTALILVDADGENMIAVAPGANERLSAAHISGAADAIAAADVVLIRGVAAALVDGQKQVRGLEDEVIESGLDGFCFELLNGLMGGLLGFGFEVVAAERFPALQGRLK